MIPKKFLFVCLVVVALSAKKVSTTIYMDENCGRTFIRNGDRLKSQRSTTHSNNLDCTLTLTAPALYDYIGLDFEWMALEEGFEPDTCHDYLEVYDGPNIVTPLLRLRACGFGTPLDLHSLGDTLTLRLVTDFIIVNEGFSLIFTSYNTAIEGACNVTNDFHCGNFRCIDQSLLCDGKNNCGNNNDEQNCPDNGGGAIFAGNRNLSMVILLFFLSLCIKKFVL
ncbi:low-density lipoprotein receptor class A domain-containing protein 2-like [Glandiceps talaboti]